MIDTLLGYNERATWTAGMPPRDPALVKILGNKEVASGVEVDRVSVLGYPAVWRGVSVIANTVARLPLVVYRNMDGEGKERARLHPAYRLLRRQANPLTTASTLMKTLTAHAILEGNGYASIERDGGGNPTKLWQMLPDRTFPVVADGELWYVTTVAGQQFTHRAEDVIHIRGLSYDGLTGYPLIEVAAEALGLGLAAQNFTSAFFGNGAHSDGVLMVPGKLSAEARENLRRGWNKMHQGTDKSFRIAVLEESATYQPLTIAAREAQLIESRGFDAKQVANLLNLPPHVIGDDAKSSYASLEQEMRSLLEHSFDPWLTTWEDECTAKLLTPQEQEQETHSIEFLREAMLRADTRTEIEMLISEVNNGILSANEARRKLNMESLPDELGDRFRKPENIGWLDAEPETEPEPEIEAEANPEPEPDDPGEPDEPSLTDAQRQLLTTTTARAVRRIAEHARRASQHHRKFGAWCEAWWEEHAQPVTDMIAEAAAACEADGDRLCERLRETCEAAFSDICNFATPRTLVATVDRECNRLAEHLPAKLIEEIQ